MNEQKKLKRGQRPEGWKNSCPKFKEYYSTLNPNWSDQECVEAARKYCRSINWQCIEFYTKKYPDKTLEECEKLRKEAIFNKRSNSPQYIEYYQKRFPNATEEEQLEMLNKYTKENNFQSIEYYQKRFPNATEEEQLEMLNNAKKDYLAKRPDNSGENNPAHRSKTSSLERRQRSPKCIEFYQLKYPGLTIEDYENMVNEHKKLTASCLTPEKHSTKIEYWLAKGYAEEEAKIKLSERQRTFDLKYCINKYGEEEGRRVFEERQIKWQKSLRENFLKYGDGRSAGSEFAYSLIGDICKRLCIKRPLKEKYISDKDGNHYSYDFCLNKKFIEFNGDYWHMNPKLYKATDINKTSKKTAQEIWDYDAKKKKCAEDCGYKILYIWESEYIESKEKVIKKCMKFLTS